MEQLMKIEFTNEQLMVLNQAIVELPYRLAAPLIAHINAEIQKQQAAKPEEAKE